LAGIYSDDAGESWSKEEIIPQPDPECFFDMNLKLMKALYGDKALEQLQEE
jgi:hypothetical protein